MAACRMTEDYNYHLPVLLNEVLEHLVIKPNGIYVDATFGRGGHARQILNQLGPDGKLLAMDKDPEAIAFAKQNFGADPRFIIQHGSFSDLADFLKSQKVYGSTDGILFDLGVSSPQLENPERGFSFMREGQLDMRMDYSRGMDAKTWLATISEEELSKILWVYGEEKFSKRIARVIVTARETKPIESTFELATLISKAVPFKQKGKHPATQTFQAIRIAINSELDDLQKGLNAALEALKIHGRLLIISFHSLEDRIVKHFMQDEERGQSVPRHLPIRENLFQPRLKKVCKAIKPSLQEVNENPRARSAILRIGEKLS